MCGDMSLAANPADVEAARAAYDEARRVAAEQGAGMLVLRTAISEARLADRLGLPDEGHAQLKAARATIIGNGSADLSEAAVLLSALSVKSGSAIPRDPAPPRRGE